jgi:transcriptional regulator with XRE-family HTH domain
MKIKPKKNYLVQFGTLVVTSRRAAHITQEALAEKAGLHPNFYGRVERGEDSPSLVTILKMADALRLDPGDLLTGIQMYEVFWGQAAADKGDIG